jgi:hypothetical protein
MVIVEQNALNSSPERIDQRLRNTRKAAERGKELSFQYKNN